MRPLTSAAYLAWRHALRTQHDRAQLSQKVLYTNYDTTNIKTPISIHRNQKKKTQLHFFDLRDALAWNISACSTRSSHSADSSGYLTSNGSDSI